MGCRGRREEGFWEQQRQLAGVATGKIATSVSRKPQRAARAAPQGPHPLPRRRSGAHRRSQTPQPLRPAGGSPACVGLGGGDGDGVAPVHHGKREPAEASERRIQPAEEE